MSLTINQNPLIKDEINDNKEQKNNNNNKNKDSEYFGDGEFEFVDAHSQLYFKSAHQTISRCELWNWMRNFEPQEGRGFMFSEGVPELERLNDELFKDPVNSGHSGASYGITMRNMEYIAKNGYSAYKTMILSSK
jgi:hypothetical protein